MHGEFTKRGLGVRPRGGRPPAEAPEELLDILRTTHSEGTQYQLDISGVEQNEVEKFARLVVNGCTTLGLVPKVYGQRSGRYLRFWGEDPE